MQLALTIFADQNGEVCRFTRDKGGDPETHGADLASTCNNTLVASAAQSKGHPDTAVGIGCLAAFAISCLKLDVGVGTIYMRHPGEVHVDTVPHVYVVTPEENGQAPRIRYFESPDDTRLDDLLFTPSPSFSGTPAEFLVKYGPKAADLE